MDSDPSALISSAVGHELAHLDQGRSRRRFLGHISGVVPWLLAAKLVQPIIARHIREHYPESESAEGKMKSPSITEIMPDVFLMTCVTCMAMALSIKIALRGEELRADRIAALLTGPDAITRYRSQNKQPTTMTDHVFDPFSHGTSAQQVQRLKSWRAPIEAKRREVLGEEAVPDVSDNVDDPNQDPSEGQGRS